MKILVTGATGFIGNYLINELIKNKDLTIIATSRSKTKAKKYSWYSKVTYIEYEIIESNTTNLFKYFMKPDLVIHLAWDNLSNYNDLTHIEKNLLNHYSFLKNIIENGLLNLSCIGTCLEYGLQNGELSEDFVTNPITTYGLAKDSLRKFLQSLQNEYTFNLKWIRLFYMYGEGQSPNSLYSQLNSSIINKKTFNMSKGDQVRDYLDINQVVKNIIQISLQNKVLGIINCASGIPITILDFIKKILLIKKSNLSLNIGYYDYPKYEPFSFWADTKKLNMIIKENIESRN